jgi:hypothetical protein
VTPGGLSISKRISGLIEGSIVDHRRRRKKTLPGSPYTAAETEVATVLKNVYTQERQRHLSNQSLKANAYAPGKWEDDIREDVDTENIEDAAATKKSDQWFELAKKVLAERLDPEAFIRRQFHVLPASAKPPWPNQLNTPQAFANYTAGGEISFNEILAAFNSQRQIAENNMVVAQAEGSTPEEAWEDVLDDDDMPLSALFRYCLALSVAKKTKDERFKDIARRFRTVAALQYLQDPESYNEIWGEDWIPQKFRDRARDIYDSVYGRER